MSAPAFTPGPWRIRVVNRASGEPIGCNILYPEEAGKPDVAIASVYTPGRADARLIAAAPDLYASCALFIEQLHNGGELTAVTAMRAALAKARGEHD